MLSQLLLHVKEWLRKVEGHQEKGQGLLEYALIILLIVIIVIIALSPLGQQIRDIFLNITNALISNTP